MENIIKDWVGILLDNDEMESFIKEINYCKTKDFASFIEVINKYLGQKNFDGEFDGLAMELANYYLSKQEKE